MIVLFSIMAIGYIAGKTGAMTIEGNKVISKLLNFITNPCNILYSALCSERILTNLEVFEIMGLAIGLYVVLILFAQLIPRLLRVPEGQASQYKFMVIFSNMGYMGIPVISAIYGPEAVIEVSIFIMVYYVTLYTYGIVLICGGGKDQKFQLKNLLSPMMFATVIGLVCYLCDVRVPVVVEKTLNTVRGVTTPGAMLVIGCALSTIPIRNIFTNWRLYVIAAIKLLIVPISVYLLLRHVIANELILGVLVTASGMPVASNFTILSAQYDRDQKLASASVFVTTLLSVATVPLLMSLLFAG